MIGQMHAGVRRAVNLTFASFDHILKQHNFHRLRQLRGGRCRVSHRNQALDGSHPALAHRLKARPAV